MIVWGAGFLTPQSSIVGGYWFNFTAQAHIDKGQHNVIYTWQGKLWKDKGVVFLN